MPRGRAVGFAIVVLSLWIRPANAEEKDIEVSKDIYMRLVRGIESRCAEAWATKTTEELDKFEKQQLQLMSLTEKSAMERFTVAAEELESARTRFKKANGTFNRSLVAAIVDVAKTGGKIDTAGLKKLGQSIVAGGNATGSALTAEGNFVAANQADAELARFRSELLRATMALRMIKVMRSSLAACAKDQRSYLKGETSGDDKPAVTG